MKKLISKFVALMLIASVAIPQTFAMSVSLSGASTGTPGIPVTLTMDVTDLNPVTMSIDATINWDYPTGTLSDMTCESVNPITNSATCSAISIYSTAGIYTIDLNIYEYNLLGSEIDSTNEQDQITVSPLVPLSLMIEPITETYYVGETVILDVSTLATSGSGDLEELSIDWNSDGVIEDTLDPLAGDSSFSFDHEYTASGTYTVTVTGNDGFTDATATASITIIDYPLTVDAGADQTVTTATPVNISADITGLNADTTRINGQIQWDSEDADSIETMSCSIDTEFLTATCLSVTPKTYTTPGIYTASVMADEYSATGGWLGMSNDTVTITVTEAPAYDLAIPEAALSLYTEYPFIHYAVSNLGDLDIDTDVYNGSNDITVNYEDGTSAETESYSWIISVANEFLTAGSSSIGQFSLVGYDLETVASVTFCADGTSVLPESNEINNCLTLDLPNPDLTVSGATYTTPSFGDEFFTFNYMISNIGDGYVDEDMDTTPVTDIYIDTAYATSDSWLDYPDTNFYTPGADSTYSIDIAGGTEVVTVCVDGNDNVYETDEENNCTDFEIMYVPLSVEAGADQSITLGDTASVQAVASESDGSLDWMEFNWGDGSANDFYNAIPAGVLGVRGTHTYSTAGTYTVTVGASDGRSTTTPVTDTLTITVTSGGGSTDSDYTDLTVSDVTHNPSGESIAYTILNDGTESIDPATDSANAITVNYVDGITQTDIYAWSPLSDKNFLNAGDSSTFYYYMTGIDMTLVDSVVVCTDSSELVSESNENNNCSTLDFDNEDLVPTAILIDQETGALSYTISNQGSDDVDSEVSIETSIVLDSIVELTDTPTTSSDRAFMMAGGSSTIAVTTLMNYGLYIVEVCVDSTDTVIESNEDNNCTRALVNYAAPVESTFVVEAGIDQSVYLGTSTSVSAIATGLSSRGVGAVANINWGDGNLEHVVGVLDASGVIFAATHTYTVAGTYTVTVDATELDSDGLEIVTVSDSLNVVIKPVETTTPPTTGGDTPTYGGGSGGSSHSSSSSSSAEDDQEVTVTDDGTTVVEDDQTVVVTEDSTTDVCGELPFTDVSPNASYYDSIYQAWCDGVVHGRTATTFDPTSQVLRGEVAKIVAGIFGYTPVADLTETSYSDLDPNENLAPYIQSLTNAGILEGYQSEGTFRFDQGMTVSEIEALMGRLGETVDVSAYSDNGSTVSRGRFMEFILQYLN